MAENRSVDKQPGRRIGAITFLILITGWIIRGYIQFQNALPPGINGGYYPVQVRSILTNGKLGIADFPLLFYLQAAFAIIPQWIWGESAILMTTRISDVFLPVLIAIPAVLITNEFSSINGKQKNPMIPLLISGLFVVCNGSLLRMLGDFQKNSFGLVLALTYFYFLLCSFRMPIKRNLWLTIAFLLLTFLTHIGVSGMTLLFSFIFLFFFFLFSPEKKRLFRILLIVLLIVVISMTLVMVFDPERVERLLSTIIDPSELFKDTAIQRWLAIFSRQKRGGVDTSDIPNLIAIALGLFGFVIGILFSKKNGPFVRSFLIAGSLTSIVLALPIINPAYAQRFLLMAFVPAVIPLAWLATNRKAAVFFSILIVAIEMFFNLGSRLDQQSPSIALEAFQELEQLEGTIPAEDTLVYARHGLEWWVAWAMDTDVTNRADILMENWEEYDRLYFILEKNRKNMTPAAQLQSTPKQPPGQNAPREQNTPADVIILPGGDETKKERYILQPTDIQNTSQGTYFAMYELLNLPQLDNQYEQRTRVRIISRTEWGARPLNLEAEQETGIYDKDSNPTGVLFYRGDLTYRLHTFVIHHSALPPAVGVKEIQDLHMDKRGFADIGYHFVIDAQGNIFEGRPLNIRGAHVAQYNTGAVGIVLTGNFEERQPTPAQLKSLQELLKFLSTEFEIRRIAGHRDLNPDLTECPGKFLYNKLPALADQCGLEFGEAQ